MESRNLHTATSSETLVSETEHGTKRDDVVGFPTAQKGWKPRSMTAPVLIPIALLALLIAATIEFLAQRSRLNGGLALAPTQDDIPRYAMLCYLYLPTVIAVIFSLIWHWVDLDVKRMQPWFELSKADGATAENSLFLDYPYDFVGIVPFKSARRRHWPVFLSSTVVVAIFWLVTPLQSSILGTGVVTREETVTLSTRSRLASLEEQKTLISPQILTMGYSIGWLDQAFPPFTTATYATLPFYVDNDLGHSRPKMNWTATTTKLTTELECWPAELSPYKSASSGQFNAINGQGCNATMGFYSNSNITMLYIGYYSDPYSEFALADSGQCPPTGNSTRQFLAVWAQGFKTNGTMAPHFEITALFCQAHYYKQQVSVSVAVDTLQPDNTSIVALSPREPLTDQEFNGTAFEYMLVNGLPLPIETRDMPFNYVIEQHPRLDKTNITKPVSNMVGYALAGHNEPAGRYKDPKILHEAFNSAHQYLFSSAVYNLLVNETDFPNRTATSTYALSGIIVSRKIAAAVESLLVMAAVCILGLLWSCHKSTSHLHLNPSSISRHVEIFRNSRDVNRLFYTVDCADDKSLRRLFPHDRFRLLRNGASGAGLCIERVSGGASCEAETLLKSQPGYYKPFRPLALRRVSGFSFVLIQVSALAVIAYLKSQETKYKGLMSPSNNFEVQQLLENFIPTIFATLTEPFLVLLNRFLCVLQPFKALSLGRSIASESLDVTYSSISPQLVFWKAIKSRHILLATICIVSLLSNVLAVGLSALFKGSPTTISYAQNLRPILVPEFDDNAVGSFQRDLSWKLITSSTYQDHMYLAKANISLGTALPPWTSTEYFFQPHIAANSTGSNSSYQFAVSTRGFGVDANCSPVAVSPIPVNISSVPSATANNLTCDGALDLGRAAMRSSTFPRPNGPSAIEYSRIAKYQGHNNCSKDMVFGWGRNLRGQDVKAPMTASFAICRPIFQTALFNVTYDALGNIISYHRTSNITTTLDYAESENHTASMLSYANEFLGFGHETEWHNDTLSRSWMNYLVAVSLGTRDHLDAFKPAPDPRQLVETIDSVYRLLFVLLLSLNQQLFKVDNSNTFVIGTEMREERRVFMAQPAYIISVTILGLNAIAAVAFYWRANVSTLPRMPTSIGSMLAYVASSRMVQEDQAAHQDGDRTYSFGRFIGVDKEAHLGIDCDPHVALISPDSLKEKRALLSSMGSRDEKRRSVRDGIWI